MRWPLKTLRESLVSGVEDKVGDYEDLKGGDYLEVDFWSTLA